jgi:predicted nucleic acid-binding Zn ribbon protein
MPTPSILAQQLIRDAREHDERQRLRRLERDQSRAKPTIDPFAIGKWAVVAGSDPGYLPSTPMRVGTAGFWIACRCCGLQFESKGLAYCETCKKLPAQERTTATPQGQHTGRMCSECGKAIPHKKRAGTEFCSNACRNRSARERARLTALDATSGTDNRATLSGSPPPDSGTDDGGKT